MTVYLRQGSVWTEIGSGAVLHSVFSTIALRLEHGVWGSRFPVVMSKLYQGQVSRADGEAAHAEMQRIRAELAQLPADQVIWDADRPGLLPPPDQQTRQHGRTCSAYWITTTGRNVVDELIDNLESLLMFGGTLDVVSHVGPPG